MHLAELKAKSPADLLSFAESLQIENASSLRKQDMMFAILKQLAECEKMCSMADKAITGEKVENAAICTHCTSIEKQLAVIRKEEDAMLKKLGISLPGEHADHKDHEHDAKK